MNSFLAIVPLFVGVNSIDVGVPVVDITKAPFNSIVKLAECTGVLVAKDTVVTAGHWYYFFIFFALPNSECVVFTVKNAVSGGILGT